MGLQGAQSSQWDQIFEEIAAGRVFTRGATVVGAPAGQGGVQLFNPAGSGKTIQVARAYVSTVVAQSVSFQRPNAALTFLTGAGHSMLTGAFDSAAEIRTATTTPVGFTIIFTVYTAARADVLVLDRWGPDLAPGEGYEFFADTTNSEIRVRFDWIERDA